MEPSGTEVRSVTRRRLLPGFGNRRFAARHDGAAQAPSEPVQRHDFRSLAAIQHQRRAVVRQFAGQRRDLLFAQARLRRATARRASDLASTPAMACARAASDPGRMGSHTSARPAVRDSTARPGSAGSPSRAAITLPGVPQPSSSGAPKLSTVRALARSTRRAARGAGGARYSAVLHRRHGAAVGPRSRAAGPQVQHCHVFAPGRTCAMAAGDGRGGFLHRTLLEPRRMVRQMMRRQSERAQRAVAQRMPGTPASDTG